MWQIVNGNNVDVLRQYPDNTFDSIITDPPYGIAFLGKSWDATVGALETYQECLRVLKPGGHILAFSAARTYHHLAVTLEQAGFEIRDQIMWIYSSGFPKSQDIGRSIQRSLGVKEKKIINKITGYTNKEGVTGREKWMNPGNTTSDDYAKQQEQVVITDPEAQKWAGWGTALKPAHEPICLARKPLDKDNSIARNCQQWGVGALNIDATRIDWLPGEQEKEQAWREKYTKTNTGGPVFAEQKKNDLKPGGQTIDAPAGRFPSNVIGEIAEPYQKYFYCPKVSRAERHVGFDTAKIPQIGSTHPDDVKRHPLWDPSIGGDAARLKKKITEAGQYKGNNHPTVKPIDLMKYLIKLVTPPGGHVLDPFNGSGSTGCAAVDLGYDYTGIELDPNYVAIAQRRIQAWEQQHKSGTTFEDLFE